MNAKIVSVLAAAVVCSTYGNEIISNVTLEQDAGKKVTVTYTLPNCPAIVTVDFLTNGVSIGEENFSNVAGDVNRLVTETGSERTITWLPLKSWPGHISTSFSAKVTAWLPEEPPDYMVVPLGEENIRDVAYYVSTNALPDGGLTNDAYRTSRLLMRRIKAAGVRWQMGATRKDYEMAGSSAQPKDLETAHMVTLSYDYFMGGYPITQEQYRRFTGAAKLGGYFTDYEDSAIRPRSGVNYDTLRGSGTGTGHAVGNSSAIKKLRNFTGIDFDLPSDAEWEYACKAGTTWLLYSGEAYTSANVNKLGWVWANSLYSDVNERQTHPVGLKLPNAWGLYDMIGNTWEWCRDKCDGSAMSLGTEEVVDPVGVSGDHRVMRGLRFNYSGGDYGRTTYRAYDVPNRGSDQTNAYGFRVMCPVALKFE